MAYFVVYLNDFDQYIKREVKIRNYGRYVDDMIFFHNDINYLESLLPKLSDF
jgi:hypothetical protein